MLRAALWRGPIASEELKPVDNLVSELGRGFTLTDGPSHEIAALDNSLTAIS